MKPDWLRRFAITESELPLMNLTFHGDHLWRETPIDLSPIYTNLRKIPPEFRDNFILSANDDSFDFYIFGRGISNTEKIALWILDRGISENDFDPFHWMKEYPIFALSPAELLRIEGPPAIANRSVDRVREIYKNGDGAFLLGAAQALVDGSKIRLRRSQPDAQIIEDLWAFLPYSARHFNFCSYWPSEIKSEWGIVIVPETEPEVIPGLLSEDQCREYPENTFEKNLQYALEEGDQAAFDKLMARRSPKQTLKLALWIVAASLVVLFLSQLLAPRR